MSNTIDWHLFYFSKNVKKKNSFGQEGPNFEILRYGPLFVQMKFFIFQYYLLKFKIQMPNDKNIQSTSYLQHTQDLTLANTEGRSAPASIKNHILHTRGSRFRKPTFRGMTFGLYQNFLKYLI